MAATKYSYTLDHYINTTRLMQNIADSSIIIALDYINSSGMTYDVWMKDVLSVGDEATLDTLVATCSNDPLPYQPQGVTLQTPAGVDTPMVDSVPVMLPNLFPIGVSLDIVGAGDDPNGARGAGAQFNATAPAGGADVTVEWQFKDWVVMAGGGMSYSGAQIGDHATMAVTAPASAVTPNGGNTGNCNLVDPGVGAAILVVPAAGNGAYDVDLSTAVPVPAINQNTGAYTGYYDWSDPNTGLGAVTVGSPGASVYNLFAVAIPLSQYATKFQLLGDRSINLTLPAVKPGKILPQWKSKAVFHTAETLSQAKLVWFLITARMRTV